MMFLHTELICTQVTHDDSYHQNNKNIGLALHFAGMIAITFSLRVSADKHLPQVQHCPHDTCDMYRYI